jgi:hypothetical protein
MNSIRTAPPVTPGAPADSPADPNPATCPMCHVAHPSLTRAAVAAGEGWRCSRCAQIWDEERLAAVAAYARWVLDRALMPGLFEDKRASHRRHVPREQDGHLSSCPL